MDEPSSSLDDETEKFVIESIVNFTKQSNKTVIMVTHSIDIAEKYGEEIINLYKGGITN
ncbi:MAG: hypothetical protein ACTH0B_03255 [Senegalia sp. (in: firmicutes)]